MLRGGGGYLYTPLPDMNLQIAISFSARTSLLTLWTNLPISSPPSISEYKPENESLVVFSFDFLFRNKMDTLWIHRNTWYYYRYIY